MGIGNSVTVAWRGDDWTPNRLGQPGRGLVACRVLDAAACDDDRSVGANQKGRRLSDCIGIGGRDRLISVSARRGVGVEVSRAREHIARQVDLDRAAPRRKRDPKRFANQLWHSVSRRRGPDLLCDRCKQGLLIDLLERVAVQVTGGKRACKRDDRRVCGLGLGQTGDQIGRTGAVLTCNDHAGAARRTSKTVGHVRASAFVVNPNERHIVDVVERVEQLHRGGADQAENMTDALGL